VIGVVSCAAGVAFTADLAAPQGRRPTADPIPTSIAREWNVRGIAISPSGPIAVLEYRPTGRHTIVRVGDTVRDGVAVSAIAPEGVVLDAAGQHVPLRLGHGGDRRVPSRPSRIPPSRARARW
jgi:hypothetical protein